MAAFRQFLAGLRILLVLTVVLGIGYPLLVLGIGQLAFPGQANGSLVQAGGQDVGSALLGQSFTGPRWFHPRPSAAGNGYDPMASGGTNLGPNSPTLTRDIRRTRAEVAAQNRVPRSAVPPDAVTSSASGLDPDISPTYAYQQVTRIAVARGLDRSVVRRIVTVNLRGRILGFLGEPHVNVLDLNLALVRAAHPGR
jgi:K+-transporting ATPase ATPase C chain